jgi:hypothetical protein
LNLGFIRRLARSGELKNILTEMVFHSIDRRRLDCGAGQLQGNA